MGFAISMVISKLELKQFINKPSRARKREKPMEIIRPRPILTIHCQATRLKTRNNVHKTRSKPGAIETGSEGVRLQICTDSSRQRLSMDSFPNFAPRRNHKNVTF
jgi:hypothetical protein